VENIRNEVGMNSSKNIRSVKMTIIAFVLAIAMIFSYQFLEAAGSKGVVVENVEKNSQSEKAGVQTGDVIFSWKRQTLPKVPCHKAKGKIRNVFEWIEMITEQTPRGPIQLKGKRLDKKMTWIVHRGRWGIDVQPLMPESILLKYREAMKLIDQGDFQQSMSLFTRIITEQERRSDMLIACWLSWKSGLLFEKIKQYELAHRCFQNALSSAEKGKLATIKPHIWLEIGKAYRRQRLYQESESAFQTALKLYENKSDTSMAYAVCLAEIGSLLRKQRNLKSSEEYCRKALRIMEKAAPESLVLARNLNNLGLVRLKKGDLTAAEEYYNRALVIWEKQAPHEYEKAMLLNNMGNLSLRGGNLSRAENIFTRALTITRQHAPGEIAEALILVNLGVVTWRQGNLTTAENYYEKAYKLLEKLTPGNQNIAACLNNLGTISMQRGDLFTAEEYYKKALSIIEKHGPQSLNVAHCLNNLGLVATDRWDFSTAEDYHKKALAIREKLAPGSLDVAASFDNLGIIAYTQKDLSKAEKYNRQALAIFQKQAPDSMEEAAGLNNLGRVIALGGDLKASTEYHRKSLAIRNKIAPGSLTVATSLVDLGTVAFKKGDYSAAEDYYKKALTILDKLAPDSFKVAVLLNSMGKLYEVQEKLPQALFCFQQSIDALEAQRSSWGNSERSLELFSEAYSDFYRDLIALQNELNYHEEAFLSLERFRARSLLNMIAERDLDLSKDAPEELIRVQKLTNFEYDKVQQTLAQISPVDDADLVDELLSKLKALRSEQRDIGERIKKASPRLGSLQYPEPLDLAGVKAFLDPETLFISYCVGEKVTHIFALLNSNLSVYSLPLERTKLKDTIVSYRKLLATPFTPLKLVRMKSFEIYQTIFKSIENERKRAKRIVICADGPLHLLPFSCLLVNKSHYLVEEIPVSHVISATVYRESLKDRPRKSRDQILAAFGDPVYTSSMTYHWRDFSPEPLPATRLEVESICNLFGESKKYLGEAAREEKAKMLGKDIKAIHFACHGILDEQFPLNSGLALSTPEQILKDQDNGIFQAWEILETLRIDADLVTLSACQSGLGKDMGGEGLIGLTRAFLYAGSRSVLSTLWAVEDTSSAAFMRRFYSFLKEGKSMTEALQFTQIEFIEDSMEFMKSNGVNETPADSPPQKRFDVSHPFYWGGFLLNGKDSGKVLVRN